MAATTFGLSCWVVMVSDRLAEQDVEIVIAKHTLSPPCFDETLNDIDDGWAVWSSVRKVANEDKSAAIGMCSIAFVTEVPYQRP